MRICPIASGSKGNCILVCSDQTNLLVDVGITYRDFSKRCEEIGFTGKIDGILVTHAHNDHIKGIAKMCEMQESAVVYAGRLLWRTLYDKINVDKERCRSFEDAFSAGDIDVLPFPTQHDVDYSCGFTFDCDGDRVSVATDLGEITPPVMESIKGSQVVLLESNYDENMLLDGDYPPYLKQRIMSSHGHLSNTDCAKACVELAKNNVETIILGHLSENNNLPELALDRCLRELRQNDVAVGSDVRIELSYQHRPGAFYTAKKGVRNGRR